MRIPSVSWPAFDPAHVAESAEAVAELLRGTGVFDLVEVRRAPVEDGSELGQPAVVASRPARNGRPTVLLYAHHDVQPPGKDEDWETPPFEPTQRGDRLHGRGAADDKAGVMAHVGAIRAFAEASGDFDLGIAVFIEGEEEWASRSFANFLHENRDLLAADAIIVADSGNWDLETPAITVALRGAVAFNLRIDTLAHASHSGMYGGAVPDAMLAAIRLLDTLWDADGSVAVDGLRSADLETPEYDEAQLRAEAGLLDGVSPIGNGTILSRIWAKPAITITGIDAPDVANASNTLVPGVRVRVSARIAPGQDADEAFAAIRAHLEANAPFGARLTFEDVDTGPGVPRRHERLGGRRDQGRDGRGLGPRARRDRRRRVHPVHRRARRRVPRRADPRDRRGGSRLPRAQPERVAAPRRLQARAAQRGAVPRPPRRARDDFLSKDRTRTPFRRLPWREVPRSLTHRGET